MFVEYNVIATQHIYNYKMSTNIFAQWLDSWLLRLYFGNIRIIMTSDELEIDVYCCSPTLNDYCDVIFGLAHKQLTIFMLRLRSDGQVWSTLITEPVPYASHLSHPP